jgi:molybdenum transport protein
MMLWTQAELDTLLLEDVPLHDETVRALSMPNVSGVMDIVARESAVVCGVDLVSRLAKQQGLSVEVLARDGTQVAAGEKVLSLYGRAQTLHLLWKQSVNLLEHLSGVATYTRKLVDAARVQNPHLGIGATRKALPGSRKLLQQAVLTGGGFIHRAGLSESVLVFAQHRAFLDNPDDWVGMLEQLRQQAPEKMLMLEAETEADALAIAHAGADVLQLDKLKPAALRALIPQLRAIAPRMRISAAGGINLHNVADYAASGVDVLITSSMYHAPLCDFGVTMNKIDPR